MTKVNAVAQPKRRKQHRNKKIDPKVAVMTDYVREHALEVLPEDGHIFRGLTEAAQQYLVALNQYGNKTIARKKIDVTYTCLWLWRHNNPHFARLEEMVLNQGGMLGRHMLENLQFAASAKLRGLLDSDKESIVAQAAKIIVSANRPLPTPLPSYTIIMPSGWAASELIKREIIEGDYTDITDKRRISTTALSTEVSSV